MYFIFEKEKKISTYSDENKASANPFILNNNWNENGKNKEPMEDISSDSTYPEEIKDKFDESTDDDNVFDTEVIIKGIGTVKCKDCYEMLEKCNFIPGQAESESIIKCFKGTRLGKLGDSGIHVSENEFSRIGMPIHVPDLTCGICNIFKPFFQRRKYTDKISKPVSKPKKEETEK